MLDVFELFFSYGTAAVAVPLIVFFVVVGLAVRQAVTFGVMITLLAFGLVAGFVIANYDITRGPKGDVVAPETLQALTVSVESLQEELTTKIEKIGTEQESHTTALEQIAALTQQVLDSLEKTPEPVQATPVDVVPTDESTIPNLEAIPSA